MAGSVPRNYPDLKPFLPEGWMVVREKGGITTIKPVNQGLKDERDHELACMCISRCDEEVELRPYAVGDCDG